MTAKLALEDGTVFTGRACGAPGTLAGEVVFNTAHTGYQEVLTDPSYCGQIVTMTFPLIGNTGVNPDDYEAARPHLAGFVVKELPPRPSNFRSTEDLPHFLTRLGIVGIAGVDTRALTRRLRVHGALRGVISTEIRDDVELVRRAQAAPNMAGANLVSAVAPRALGSWSEPLPTFGAPPGPPREPDCHVVVLDCGAKASILRHLVACGAAVTLAPAGAAAGRVRALNPDALVISNGPGDPAAVTDTIATLREMLGEVPMFGICLGHQMLALALGAETYKLRFGHHGTNVPVLNRHADRAEITSQNHGFAVRPEALERCGAEVTHVNLNDGSVEGFLAADQQIMAVQFHPEANPGPHDASGLFGRFVEAVRTRTPLSPNLLAR